MEAHALAMMGDKSASLRALQDAEIAYNASHRDTPPWLVYFDDAYLAARFAHTFRDLRMPMEAESFARRSLEMSDGYERGRMFNTALLASTLAEQGNVAEACAVGHRAVAMATDVRSTRGTRYLDDLGQRLQPCRATADVRGLYAAMADSGLSTPLRRRERKQMQQPHLRRSPDDLPISNSPPNGCERNPLDSFSLIDVRRLADEVGTFGQEQQILVVSRADTWLE